MQKWVYVSMSLLAGLAVGTQAESSEGVASSEELSVREVSTCLQRLKLDKAPDLPNGSPCYSSVK